MDYEGGKPDSKEKAVIFGLLLPDLFRVRYSFCPREGAMGFNLRCAAAIARERHLWRRQVSAHERGKNFRLGQLSQSPPNGNVVGRPRCRWIRRGVRHTNVVHSG